MTARVQQAAREAQKMPVASKFILEAITGLTELGGRTMKILSSGVREGKEDDRVSEHCSNVVYRGVFWGKGSGSGVVKKGSPGFIYQAPVLQHYLSYRQ